ncbi:MAG: transketolase [Deltaproteobacteria bacterium]|nr:transketolase [Deltaproteobacteria bacterium]
MTTLPYIPKAEFDRLIRCDCSPVQKSRALASFCRINTLYMIRKAGSGHIGSSFSSLDIVSWVLLNELRPVSNGAGFRDLYFSSKGHDAPGLYAVMTALGIIPFDMIHKLRRLGGLPGHPDVHTPGIPANSGSLGMGISKAKGMILADRLAGRDRRIFVMTGDGELQEGQIWESLASAANRQMGELTVIVDRNKLQSDIWVHKTSDIGDLKAKFEAFGWLVQCIDGHDHEAIGQSIASARAERKRPAVIIAETVKGKGTPLFEHRVSPNDSSLYRFHSGAPDIETCRKAMEDLLDKAREAAAAAGLFDLSLEKGEITLPASPKSPQRLVEAYAQALVEQGKKRKDLVVLDADLKLDCGLIPFEQEFPERFIECGIAEQDMVSQAGGLALSGMLPVVHSFACFLTTRANEQIYTNATEETRIIYVGSLAGIVPGGPGHSHQSVRDISILSAVPGLTLVEPCCDVEVAMALDWAINNASGSTYIRLVSIPCDIPFDLPEGYVLELGRGCLLQDGKDVLLIGYGPVLLTQAWQAAQTLERELGQKVAVLNLPWLNIVDEAWFVSLARRFPNIITLDNHYVKGGQGEMLAVVLCQRGVGSRVKHLGLRGVPCCGTNDEVLHRHGLDAVSILLSVKDVLEC